MATIERLVSRGFIPVIFPLYPTAVGVRRGDYAALIAPVVGAGFRIVGVPCYMIDGHFAVRIKHKGREFFMWKKRQVEATSELLAGLKNFSDELSELLLPVT